MLPAVLQAGIDRLLEGVSRNELAERATALSESYRDGAPSATAITSGIDALAYAVARMPATYAAVAAALASAAERVPKFAPQSLFDVGAGPGTASWAATAVWSSLAQVTMVDKNRYFRELAGKLTAGSDGSALSRADYRSEDIGRPTVATLAADVIVAGYALAELDAGQQSGVVARLWEAARGMLVLVEPGTPAGYARILAARRLLIEAGAQVLAPCPHAGACPIQPPDWCHFAVRLSRSREHRLAKSASLPFEDEKFSYIAAGRTGGALAPVVGRILAPPRVRKADVAMKVCTPAGIVERHFPRRDRASFASVRRLGWGGAILK